MIKNLFPFTIFSSRKTTCPQSTLMSNDAFLLVFFVLPSLFMALIARIPKFLITYWKKPKEIQFDRNLFFCILAGEVMIFTFAFFTSHPLFNSFGHVERETTLISLIDSLSNYSLWIALFSFKVFLSSAYLLSFLLALLFFLTPAYAFVSFFMHKSFASNFQTVPGYILYTLTLPLMIILAILLSPFISEPHKEFRHVPFSTTNERNMLLYHAVHEGLPNVVSGLLENGAGVNFEYWSNRKDKTWETPLFVSFRSKRNTLEVAKILIQHGANVNHNHGTWFDILEGRTPENSKHIFQATTPYLVYLVRGRLPIHINHELIELLIESGADVNATDRKGHTYQFYLNEQKKKNSQR